MPGCHNLWSRNMQFNDTFCQLHCVVKHSEHPGQTAISFFHVAKNEPTISVFFPLIHLSPCSDLCRVEYDVLTSAYIDGVDVGKLWFPEIWQ